MKKDISDLFRNNQHKLNERPSDRTWQRLEHRLDAHYNHSKRMLYRQMSMAAAILFLIGIISLLSYFAGKKHQQDLAISAHPTLIEELPIVDTETNAKQIVEFQKRYQDRATDIEEGDIGKKLLVANKR